MLQRAEIMLLDEPTNHLDVKNVAWLVNYLTTLTDVTSVIVSHDSGFLDNVCQSIIHYENRKLKIYKVRSAFSFHLLLSAFNRVALHAQIMCFVHAKILASTSKCLPACCVCLM